MEFYKYKKIIIFFSYLVHHSTPLNLLYEDIQMFKWDLKSYSIGLYLKNIYIVLNGIIKQNRKQGLHSIFRYTPPLMKIVKKTNFIYCI